MALKGLDGKVAVVTGAAGGIGRAASLRLADEGAQVVLVDLDEVAAKVVADSLGATGTHVLVVGADVSTEEGTDADARRALTFGRVDLLHANAGVEGPLAAVPDYPIADFDRIMSVNVRGVFLGVRAVMHHQRAVSAGGSIVITSSVAGLMGSPLFPAYVASKHAVIGLAKCAARDGGPFGVRVQRGVPRPDQHRHDAATRVGPRRRAGRRDGRADALDGAAGPLRRSCRGRCARRLAPERRGVLRQRRRLHRRRRPALLTRLPSFSVRSTTVAVVVGTKEHSSCRPALHLSMLELAEQREGPCLYAQGRTYFDADSHLMETSDWLVGYADPALRDKIRPLHLGGAGAMAEHAVPPPRPGAATRTRPLPSRTRS